MSSGLLYSFVARDRDVLAEHSAISGNFRAVALECLQNSQITDEKFTVTADAYTFNYLVASGYSECGGVLRARLSWSHPRSCCCLHVSPDRPPAVHALHALHLLACCKHAHDAVVVVGLCGNPDTLAYTKAQCARLCVDPDDVLTLFSLSLYHACAAAVNSQQTTAFLVVADEAYGRQIPFAFLERLRDAFLEKYAERGRAAPDNSLNSQFG